MRREFFILTEIQTADGPFDASISGFCSLFLDLHYGADADGRRGEAVCYVADIVAERVLTFDEGDGLPRRVEASAVLNWAALEHEIANAVLEREWQETSFAGL